jgi:hypothetical protein
VSRKKIGTQTSTTTTTTKRQCPTNKKNQKKIFIKAPAGPFLFILFENCEFAMASVELRTIYDFGISLAKRAGRMILEASKTRLEEREDKAPAEGDLESMIKYRRH